MMRERKRNLTEWINVHCLNFSSHWHIIFVSSYLYQLCHCTDSCLSVKRKQLKNIKERNEMWPVPSSFSLSLALCICFSYFTALAAPAVSSLLRRAKRTQKIDTIPLESESGGEEKKMKSLLQQSILILHANNKVSIESSTFYYFFSSPPPPRLRPPLLYLIPCARPPSSQTAATHLTSLSLAALFSSWLSRPFHLKKTHLNVNKPQFYAEVTFIIHTLLIHCTLRRKEIH